MVLTGVHWSLPLASWNIYWCPELPVAQCVSEKILGSPFSSFRSRLLNNMQDLIKHKGYSKLESNSSRRNFRGTGERPKLPSIQACNLSCSYRHTSNQHKLAAEQCSTFQPSFIHSFLPWFSLIPVVCWHKHLKWLYCDSDWGTDPH